MENGQDFNIDFSFEKERKFWNNLFANSLIHIPTNINYIIYYIILILLNTVIVSAGKQFFLGKILYLKNFQRHLFLYFFI